MMKPKKVIIIIIVSILVLLFLNFVGRGIYQVLCISCTIPPIKTYEFIGSKERLEAGIKKYLNNNHSIKYQHDGTVGDSKDGFAYDISIKDSTTNDSVSIRYEEFRKSDLKMVKIKVISIFDTKTWNGGYGIKADGMNKLLNNFESSFIIPLNKQQHIILTPEQ